MKIYYPGVLMIPILLLFFSCFGIIQVYWPVTLIATGLEELYLWSTSKSVK